MRVKRAVHARKRKKAYFEAAKGYRGGRSRLWRTVKDAVERSREYSFRIEKPGSVIFVVYGLPESMRQSENMV